MTQSTSNVKIALATLFLLGSCDLGESFQTAGVSSRKVASPLSFYNSNNSDKQSDFRDVEVGRKKQWGFHNMFESDELENAAKQRGNDENAESSSASSKNVQSTTGASRVSTPMDSVKIKSVASKNSDSESSLNPSSNSIPLSGADETLSMLERQQRAMSQHQKMNLNAAANKVTSSAAAKRETSETPKNDNRIDNIRAGVDVRSTASSNNNRIDNIRAGVDVRPNAPSNNNRIDNIHAKLGEGPNDSVSSINNNRIDNIRAKVLPQKTAPTVPRFSNERNDSGSAASQELPPTKQSVNAENPADIPFLSDETMKNRFPGWDTADRYTIDSFKGPKDLRNKSNGNNNVDTQLFSQVSRAFPKRQDSPPSRAQSSNAAAPSMNRSSASNNRNNNRGRSGMVGFMNDNERSRLFPPVSARAASTPAPPTRSPGMVGFRNDDDSRLFPPSGSPENSNNDARVSIPTSPRQPPPPMGPRPSANDHKSPGMVSFMSGDERSHLFPPPGAPAADSSHFPVSAPPAARAAPMPSPVESFGGGDLSDTYTGGSMSQDINSLPDAFSKWAEQSKPKKTSASRKTGSNDKSPKSSAYALGSPASTQSDSNDQIPSINRPAHQKKKKKSMKGMSDSEFSTLFAQRGRAKLSAPKNIDRRTDIRPKSNVGSTPKNAAETNLDAMASSASLPFTNNEAPAYENQQFEAIPPPPQMPMGSSPYGSQPSANDPNSPGMVSFVSRDARAAMFPAGGAGPGAGAANPMDSTIPAQAGEERMLPEQSNDAPSPYKPQPQQNDSRSPGMFSFLDRSVRASMFPPGGSAPPAAPPAPSTPPSLNRGGAAQRQNAEPRVDAANRDTFDSRSRKRVQDDSFGGGDLTDTYDGGSVSENIGDMPSAFADWTRGSNPTGRSAPASQTSEGSASSRSAGSMQQEAGASPYSDETASSPFGSLPLANDPKSPGMVAFPSSISPTRRSDGAAGPASSSTGIAPPANDPKSPGMVAFPSNNSSPRQGEKNAAIGQSSSHYGARPAANDPKSPGMVAFPDIEMSARSQASGSSFGASSQDDDSLSTSRFPNSPSPPCERYDANSGSMLGPRPVADDSRSPGMFSFLSDSEKQNLIPGRQQSNRPEDNGDPTGSDRGQQAPCFATTGQNRPASVFGPSKSNAPKPNSPPFFANSSSMETPIPGNRDEELRSQRNIGSVSSGPPSKSFASGWYNRRSARVVDEARSGRSRWGVMEAGRVENGGPGHLDRIEIASPATERADDWELLSAVDIMSSISVQPSSKETHAAQAPGLYPQRNFRVVASEMAGRSRWGAMESNRVRSGKIGKLTSVPMPPPLPAQPNEWTYASETSERQSETLAVPPQSISSNLAKEWSTMNREETAAKPLPGFYSVAASMAEFAKASMALLSHGIEQVEKNSQKKTKSINGAVGPEATPEASSDLEKEWLAMNSPGQPEEREQVNPNLAVPEQLGALADTGSVYRDLASEWDEHMTTGNGVSKPASEAPMPPSFGLPAATPPTRGQGGSAPQRWRPSEIPKRSTGDDLAGEWNAMNKAKDIKDSSPDLPLPTARPDILHGQAQSSAQATVPVAPTAESIAAYEELARSWTAINKDSDTGNEQDAPFVSAVQDTETPFRVSRVELSEGMLCWRTIEILNDGSERSLLDSGTPYSHWKNVYNRQESWAEIPCDNLSEKERRKRALQRKERKEVLYVIAVPNPLENAEYIISRVFQDESGSFHNQIVGSYPAASIEALSGTDAVPEYPRGTHEGAVQPLPVPHGAGEMVPPSQPAPVAVFHQETYSVVEPLPPLDDFVEEILQGHVQELGRLEEGSTSLQEEWTLMNKNTDTDASARGWKDSTESSGNLQQQGPPFSMNEMARVNDYARNINAHRSAAMAMSAPMAMGERTLAMNGASRSHDSRVHRPVAHQSRSMAMGTRPLAMSGVAARTNEYQSLSMSMGGMSRDTRTHRRSSSMLRASPNPDASSQLPENTDHVPPPPNAKPLTPADILAAEWTQINSDKK